MYLDTSVAAKLYLAEPDSDEVEAIVRKSEGLFSSELLYGELRSAILGKVRARALSGGQAEAVWAKFQEHLDEAMFTLLPVNGVVVREATEVMVQVHPDIPLRILDAIHIATFQGVDAGPFFTRDKRMLEAGRKLGLNLAGE